MICDDCKQRPAIVHISQVINGQNSELHLCQECANRRSGGQFWVNPNFLALNILSNLVHPQTSSPSALGQSGQAGQLKPVEKNLYLIGQCASCGLAYQQFLNSSLLGCSNCYTAFKQQLETLMKQFQAGLRHQGKIPLRKGGTSRLGRMIQKLRIELQKVVEQEHFEKAAVIRDQLKALEKSAEQEGKNKDGTQQV